MSDGDFISVLFELPAMIKAGIASGEFERVGGIIRQTDGKKIVVWLTEGGGFGANASVSALDPSLLGEALGSMQGALQLANGLGALNLAVNTAGFAMIRRQIEGLAQQLGTVASDVRTIQKDTAFISGLALAGIRSEIDTALEHAERARRMGNNALYHDAKIALVAVRNRVRHAAEFMLTSRLTVDKHSVFGDLLEAGAVLAIGEALCDDALEGPGIAAETLMLAACTVRTLTSDFDRQRRDFNTDPLTMLRMSAPGRVALTELHGRLVEIGNQIEGAAETVRLRARLGLDTDGWRRLTQPEGSGPVTFLLEEAKPPVLTFLPSPE